MADIDRPFGPQQATYDLLWGPPAAPKRGPKPGLTLDEIARTGIAIADAEGLAAVTMQRIAEALGVTKMALYRYLPGKAELVAVMVEVGLGAPPDDAAEGGWRAALSRWAGVLYQRFRAHPWAMEVTVGARLMGPNELGWMEAAITAMAGTGLSGAEMLDVAATLIGHVRGLVAQVAPLGDDEAPEDAMEAGLVALLAGHEDRFPGLLAAVRGPAEDRNQALDFGLERILDGVELLVTRRAGG